MSTVVWTRVGRLDVALQKFGGAWMHLQRDVIWCLGHACVSQTLYNLTSAAYSNTSLRRQGSKPQHIHLMWIEIIRAFGVYWYGMKEYYLRDAIWYIDSRVNLKRIWFSFLKSIHPFLHNRSLNEMCSCIESNWAIDLNFIFNGLLLVVLFWCRISSRLDNFWTFFKSFLKYCFGFRVTFSIPIRLKKRNMYAFIAE